MDIKRNRYGDEYWWEEIAEGIYLFNMNGDSMKYCGFSGREGVEGLDYNNLGHFDPSGGPYISIGSIVEGNPVTRIRSTDQGMIVETFDVRK